MVRTNPHILRSAYVTTMSHSLQVGSTKIKTDEFQTTAHNELKIKVYKKKGGKLNTIIINSKKKENKQNNLITTNGFCVLVFPLSKNK